MLIKNTNIINFLLTLSPTLLRAQENVAEEPIQSLANEPETFKPECFNGKTTNYEGKQAITVHGKSCLPWLDPKNLTRTMPDDPEDQKTNFCRNPRGNANGPWCYVDPTEAERLAGKTMAFDYCGITTCDDYVDPTMIIFAEYDTETKMSRLRSMFAHLEQGMKWKKKFKDFGLVLNYFNTSNEAAVAMSKTNEKPVDFAQSGHEFWAIAADELRSRIIIADYLHQRLLTFDEQERKLEVALEHIAQHIEGLAVDWRTGNVYWIDSSLNAIFICTSDFKHYTMVPLTEKPMAIALEPKSGKLIYSAVTTSDKKDNEESYRIYVCSMTVKNCEIVKKFPHISKVFSLFVDYHANDTPRLFYSDEQDDNCFVFSVPLDLEKIKNNDHIHLHMQERHSQFASIATYEGWLYAADTVMHIVQNPDHPEAEMKRHKIFIGHAQGPHTSNHDFVLNQTINSYGYKGRIQSIAVFDREDKLELIKKHQDPCKDQYGNVKCKYICLTTDNPDEPYECMCPIGYKAITDPAIENESDLTSGMDRTHCQTIQMDKSKGYFLFVDPAITQSNNRLQIPILLEYKDVAKFQHTNKLMNYTFLEKGGEFFTADHRINSMTIRHGSSMLYWSYTVLNVDGVTDRHVIARLDLDKIDAQPEILVEGESAFAMLLDIDPLTGNIYWVHQDSYNIYLAGEVDTKSYIIVEHNIRSVMLDFTIDPIQQHIYWTEYIMDGPSDATGATRLVRCKLDGTHKQVVVDDFVTAAAIDFEILTNKLYVVETEFGFFYELDLATFNSQWDENVLNVHLEEIDQEKFGIHLYTTGVYQANNLLTPEGDTGRGLMYIQMIKADYDKLYYVDVTDGIRIKMIDTKAAQNNMMSMYQYSSNVFYQMNHLDLYNVETQSLRRNLVDNRIAEEKWTGNCIACMEQGQICIPDGEKGHCYVHVETKADEIPPHHFMSCPDNVIEHLQDCQESIKWNVTNPKFLDDNTEDQDLKVHFIQSFQDEINTEEMSHQQFGKDRELTLNIGTTIVSWTATDKAGNTGNCLTQFEILSMGCMPYSDHVEKDLPDYWKNEFTYSEESCSGREGSEVVVTCLDQNKVIEVNLIMDTSDQGAATTKWQVDMMTAKCSGSMWLDPFTSQEHHYKCVRNSTEIPINLIPGGTEHEDKDDQNKIDDQNVDENRNKGPKQREEQDLDSNNDENRQDRTEQENQEEENKNNQKSNGGGTAVAIILVTVAISVIGLFAYKKYKARFMNSFRNGGLGPEGGEKTNQAYAAM